MNRLHPLTPLLRGARAFGIIIVALSWQGFAQFGIWQGGLIVAIGGICALILSVMTWLVTGFEIVDRELRVHEGLLVRRVRTVPLERMQAIEVVRSLLAQLTGLAELRIEVVGGEKSEARLAYLPLAEAEALRSRLIALSAGVTAPASSENPGVVHDHHVDVDQHILHEVSTKDLIVSQALTPAALLSPFAMLAVISVFFLNPDATFLGVAGAITAALGTIGVPVRRVLRNYQFTLIRVPVGLRIRRGATETRNQTVPLSRVQSSALVRPLLWRGPDWVRCDLHVAGVHTDGDEAFSGDTLLPVASEDIAHAAMATVLPGAAEALRMPLAPAPPAAIWRAPIHARTLGIGLTPSLFVTKSGLITPSVTLVPYQRIQAISLDQGPWQRALGLASVRVHTAGGARILAQYRTTAEATWLAAELHSRARVARLG